MHMRSEETLNYADAQAELSLFCSHKSYCKFCCALAQILVLYSLWKLLPQETFCMKCAVLFSGENKKNYNQFVVC